MKKKETFQNKNRNVSFTNSRQKKRDKETANTQHLVFWFGQYVTMVKNEVAYDLRIQNRLEKIKCLGKSKNKNSNWKIVWMTLFDSHPSFFEFDLLVVTWSSSDRRREVGASRSTTAGGFGPPEPRRPKDTIPYNRSRRTEPENGPCSVQIPIDVDLRLTFDNLFLFSFALFLQIGRDK